jgi:hypothetical protein
MASFHEFLTGNTQTKAKPASAGSFSDFLKTSAPEQTTQETPKTVSKTASKIVPPVGGTPIKVSSGNVAYKTTSGSIWEFLPDGTKVVTLADQFGGGAYNIDPKNPLEVLNTGHTNYGGMDSKTGFERDDIIPVSLGGANTKKENIRYEKLLPQDQQAPGKLTESDAYLQKINEQFKSGKITLPQARLAIMIYKNEQTNPQPKQDVKSNFASSLKDITKYYGKAAVTIPKNLAVEAAQTYTKPSDAEQHTEAQLGLNRGDPVSQFFGKIIARTLSGVTEHYAELFGGAIADQKIAEKVNKQELPPDVLGKTGGLTPNDYAEAIMASTPLALALAPFVKKYAADGVLKLSEVTETKSKIELTRSEISDITRGREDLVDPVKVEAFKSAIKDNLGTQLKETGKFTIPKSEPTSFSNFLKNSATRPVSEIGNFTKEYGADTSVSPQRLLSDGSQPTPLNAPVEPQNVPGEAITPNPGIPTSKELTYQPVEQIPLQTPEIKTSKLAQGVEQKAIEKKLTDGFGGLPEYAKVNVADQAKAASDLLSANREKAINIAMGHELPPEGILPESVFVAVENHAIQTGDVELLRNLATASSLPTEATGMGQRIRMLAERDPNSAVTAMQKVMKIKEEAATKKYGDLTKVKQKIKNQIKTEITKAAPKAKDWASFIDEIKCS